MTTEQLATTADLYCPSVDKNGNYVDVTPPIYSGIRCPCGSRRDHVYESASIFTQHTKTKAHQKWLQGLNLNKANYYAENAKLTDLVQQQRLVIAQLERDLQQKNTTITFLAQQLVPTTTTDTCECNECDE